MTQTIMKSDELIQRDVQRELKWDTRVDGTDVGVTVEHGIVTLLGTVPSAAERHAALEAAFRVSGVHDVANEIEVKLHSRHKRTDADIADAVRRALIWDVYLDEDRIKTSVTDGQVTLEGDVDTSAHRQDAAVLVRRIVGVRGVVNNLVVRHASVDGSAVASAIEEALERRSEREARRISVDVRDGVATLTGVVHSWAERRAAVGAACQTQGVNEVRDSLHLERAF